MLLNYNQNKMNAISQYVQTIRAKIDFEKPLYGKIHTKKLNSKDSKIHLISLYS